MFKTEVYPFVNSCPTAKNKNKNKNKNKQTKKTCDYACFVIWMVIQQWRLTYSHILSLGNTSTLTTFLHVRLVLYALHRIRHSSCHQAVHSPGIDCKWDKTIEEDKVCSLIRAWEGGSIEGWELNSDWRKQCLVI